MNRAISLRMTRNTGVWLGAFMMLLLLVASPAHADHRDAYEQWTPCHGARCTIGHYRTDCARYDWARRERERGARDGYHLGYREGYAIGYRGYGRDCPPRPGLKGYSYQYKQGFLRAVEKGYDDGYCAGVDARRYRYERDRRHRRRRHRDSCR